MNTSRELDKAIDQVTARMVSVEHDAAMAERIVTRLPEREQRSAWLGVFLPQAAAAVAILVAVVLWTTRERETEIREPLATAGTSAFAPSASADKEAPALQPSMSVTWSEPALLPDHERGLDPVAAPVSIELAAIEAPLLLHEPPLVIAPLALTELPLSGELISPYQEIR